MLKFTIADKNGVQRGFAQSEDLFEAVDLVIQQASLHAAKRPDLAPFRLSQYEDGPIQGVDQ